MNLKKSRLRVLVASAAGMGNIGDDLVGTLAGAIFSQEAQAEIKFASLPHKQVELEWADVVVVGGGGIFYDWSYDNVNNYLNFLEHAKYMGKKTVALGVGTQGITTDYGKRRYREVLSNMTDLITVRDEKDAAVLADIGVTRPVHVAHDLALLLPQYYDELAKRISQHAKKQISHLQQLKSGGRPLVGVSIAAYMWTDEFTAGLPQSEVKVRKAAYQTCIERIRKLARTYEVVLLLQSKDDQDFYSEIRQESSDHVTIVDVTDNKNDAVAMLDIYRQLDVALVSRYHGLLLALLAHKPVVILGTQEKIVKSIQSTLPSFSGSLFKDNQISQFFDACSDVENLQLTPQQMDEINSSIVQANKNVEFVSSFLYPFKA